MIPGSAPADPIPIRLKRFLGKNISAYAFVAPFAVIFLVFLAFPLFYSAYLSLHKVTDLYDVFGGLKFVGLANFAKLFTDRKFWWSLLMTLYYGVLVIPTGLAVSLALAVLLRKGTATMQAFRSAFFLPYVLDMLVVGIVWTLIYSPHFGLLNHLLESIGIHTFAERGFLGRPETAMPAIAFANILKGSGFGMVLYLAAIQNIPREVYEAADIDGASNWLKLRHITIPLLRPVTLFLVVVGTIGVLNAFVEVYAMTEGGPSVDIGGTALGATWVSGYYLFRTFYVDLKLGYAAAMSYVLLVLAVIISLLSRRLLGGSEE